MINKIIEETGVKIDITDDGAVNVCGTDQEMIDKAIATIKNIVTDVEPGMIYTGKVVRIMEFGAFVELEPGVDALLHVSQISRDHVDKPADALTIGQEIEAKVVDFNGEDRKISLSMKALQAPAEQNEADAE